MPLALHDLSCMQSNQSEQSWRAGFSMKSSKHMDELPIGFGSPFSLLLLCIRIFSRNP